MKREKIYQIGVVGSFGNVEELGSVVDLDVVSAEVGREIALRGHILVFGAEKDGDSLSMNSARHARAEGGLSVAITYDSYGEIHDPSTADVVIRTASERGGPRESIFIASVDGLIAISGGSGTLMESLMAYQNRKPVVGIEGTGGWVDRLGGQYFDHRKRARFELAPSASLALDILINAIDLVQAS